jgi:translation initiation factor IF-3
LIKTRFNHQIQAPEVRVITEDGEQVGVLTLKEALNLAQEHALDLVEISPNAKPPVVKLISYDKFKYQQQKLEQQQRKNAKKIEVKTIRLSARIGSHDAEVKAKQADEFLKEGNLIKIELRLKGREQAFGEIGEKQVKNFQSLIKSGYKVEVPLKRLGGTFSVTLSPTK